MIGEIEFVAGGLSIGEVARRSGHTIVTLTALGVDERCRRYRGWVADAGTRRGWWRALVELKRAELEELSTALVACRAWLDRLADCRCPRLRDCAA